jgi:DMSO/TMAO reductase YedYZ molybdopterin-dependent catalytic subunit
LPVPWSRVVDAPITELLRDLLPGTCGYHTGGVTLSVRAYGAIAGLTAAVVALGIAEPVAVGTGARSAPLVAVGGVVVDSVPEPVKESAIAVFGTHDKLALLTGTVLLLLAFAAVIGVLAVRRRWLGVAGIALFGLVGVVAALTRHDASWLFALPSLVGTVAGAAVLVVLLRAVDVRADATAADHPPAGDPYPAEPGAGVPAVHAGARRRFLQLTAAGLGVAAVAGFGGRWLASRRDVAQARAQVRLPAPTSAAPALPAEVDARVPRLASFVTPAREFYLIDTALVVPQVDPDTWSLRIHGRVGKPLTLTYRQLLERPMIERYVTLACVSNEVGGGLIGNARWLGVPLPDLLDEVDPDPAADQVVSRSVDGFTAGTPTAVLRDGRDAMLAVGMNGEPLPLSHGFPVRMVVPGLYGYVSATKWLAELELSTFDDFDAYWVRRGWARQAPVKTQSRIDTPVAGGHPSPGTVTVAGVAWAQHRGISKVEIRVDDGDWREARLAPVPSVDTWRQWTYRWDATPGKHTLHVRATDNAGSVQPEEQQPPFPDGATGWHRIDVTVS